MEAPQQRRACRRPVRAGPAGGPAVTGRCDDPGRADQDWPPGAQRGAGLPVGPQPGVKRGEPARPAASAARSRPASMGRPRTAGACEGPASSHRPGQRHRMVESHPLRAQPHPLPDLTGPQLQDGTAQPSKVIDRDQAVPCSLVPCQLPASRCCAAAARRDGKEVAARQRSSHGRSRASRIRPVILCLRARTLNIAYPCSASQPNGDCASILDQFRRVLEDDRRRVRGDRGHRAPEHGGLVALYVDLDQPDPLRPRRRHRP